MKVVNCKLQIITVVSFFFVFAISVYAAENGVSVTQTVTDNSTSGGGGASAGGDSGQTTPTPTPIVVQETAKDAPPAVMPGPQEISPTPAEETLSGPAFEIPSVVSAPETGGSQSSAETGSTIGGSSFSSGGGVIVGLTQAITVISESLTKAIENVVENSKVVVQKVAVVSKIVVENTERAVKSPVGRVTAKIVEPIGVISGGVAVGSQVLVSTVTVTSFSDVYLLIVRFFGLIGGFFRKKRKPWGTVYDSVTKRPLDPAYVSIVKENNKEVGDAITDLDGRFGFFVPAGRYVMNASKTNYSFPSKLVIGKERDELYESLYHGDPIENKEGEVIIRNIPLDPINFDWNEFEKNKQQLFRLYSEKEKKWKMAFGYVYNLGFVGAAVTAVLDGNYFNYTFLSFYILVTIYQTFFIHKRRAVTLKYEQNNEPIPYSIVRIFSPALSTSLPTQANGIEADSEIKSVVTDHLGRFYLLVGPGRYYLTVDAKQPDASYKKIYKSEVMDLRSGIVTSDIVVPVNKAEHVQQL